MLEKCDRLENQLTAREKKDREQLLAAARRFIQAAARNGGISAPVSKSYLKRRSKDIRVNLGTLVESLWPLAEAKQANATGAQPLGGRTT
jgi:hypothetical protein